MNFFFFYQIKELKEKLAFKDHLYEMVGKTANVVFFVYLVVFN